MTKQELWIAVRNYHFEHLAPPHLWDLIVEKFGGHDAATKAFASKLERKWRLRRRLALECIWEYKKFVFLGVIADFPVTPSKLIDLVWHEHILFVDGYHKFCTDVIRYDFKHQPELIRDEDQTETYRQQFERTLALYRREFGMEPPAAVWGLTKFAERSPAAFTSKDAGSGSGDDTLIGSMIADGQSADFDFGGGQFEGGGASGSWGDADDASDSSDGDSSGDSGGDSSCSSGCSSCGGGD